MHGRRLPIPLRLLRYALPYRKRILLVWCAVGGLTAFQLIGPKLVAYAIDTGLDVREVDGRLTANGSLHTLWIAAILITSAAAARGVFQFWQTYNAEWLSQ